MSDEEFYSLDKRVRLGIILNLADDVLCEIASKNTAKNMWKKLKTLYMKKLIDNRFYLNKTLYILCMSENTYIISHLNKFDSIIIDLGIQMLKLNMTINVCYHYVPSSSHLSILKTQ